MKSETRLSNRIVKWAEKHHYMHLKIHGHAMQESGWPDLLFIRRGVHLWIETKTKEGKLSAIQKQRILELRRHGAAVYVADDFTECITWMSYQTGTHDARQ